MRITCGPCSTAIPGTSELSRNRHEGTRSKCLSCRRCFKPYVDWFSLRGFPSALIDGAVPWALEGLFYEGKANG